jgi:hypothetical protein
MPTFVYWVIGFIAFCVVGWLLEKKVWKPQREKEERERAQALQTSKAEVRGELPPAPVLDSSIPAMAKAYMEAQTPVAHRAIHVMDDENLCARCGNTATHALPRLIRKKKRFSGTVYYKHVESKKLDPENVDHAKVCACCAQLADAEVDHELRTINQLYADLDRNMAQRLADFESEGLERALRQIPLSSFATELESVEIAPAPKSRRPRKSVAPKPPMFNGANGTNGSTHVS